MKEGLFYLMNDNTQENYNLEKMIKKMNKINKEKYLTMQAREKRKLNIKEKKYLPKQDVVEKDYDL